MVKSKPLMLVVAIIALTGVILGTIVERRTMRAWNRAEVIDVQAMLAFNRLKADRELRALLSKGCITQAFRVVDVAEDQDLGLILNYISVRKL